MRDVATRPPVMMQFE